MSVFRDRIAGAAMEDKPQSQGFVGVHIGAGQHSEVGGLT